ncbi:MAG TPA: hypothetical protein PKE47_13570, partial [Verrucomicrobiota bacterium]|nr:hypothetical protein [Verrucomicrobiota bacterium]
EGALQTALGAAPDRFTRLRGAEAAAKFDELVRADGTSDAKYLVGARYPELAQAAREHAAAESERKHRELTADYSRH